MKADSRKSWDNYYQAFSGNLDNDSRLIIYLVDPDEEPEVIDELEQNDYQKSNSQSQDVMRLGEYCFGECVTIDELGEEFSVDATLIFHTPPKNARTK